MPAGDQKRHVREGWRIGLEERRQEMGLQVVHAQGRDLPPVGQAPAERRPREERADQPGPCGIHHSREVLGLGRRERQGALDEGQEAAHVIPRGELRHDTAVDPVQLHLAPKLVRKEATGVIEHRRCTLITRGFNRKHTHGSLSQLWVRCAHRNLRGNGAKNRRPISSRGRVMHEAPPLQEQIPRHHKTR